MLLILYALLVNRKRRWSISIDRPNRIKRIFWYFDQCIHLINPILMFFSQALSLKGWILIATDIVKESKQYFEAAIK